MPGNEVRSSRGGWIAWALLLALAAFVRLYDIGAADTRSDEVWTVQYFRAGNGPLDAWRFTVGDFKTGRQMPLPRVLTGAFVRGLGLEVTLRSIRWPYALAGLLTIPGLWLLGYHLLDRRLAWILAFLGAINPFSVYWSRLGHVYAFVLPGLAFAAAFLVELLRDAAAGRRPRGRALVGACAGSIWACYSHLSAWPLIGLLWLMPMAVWFWRHGWKAVPPGLWLVFGLWALSILPWAAVFVSALFTASSSFIDTAGNPINSLPAMWRLPFAMSWGGGPLRAPVTVLLLAAGVVGGAWNRATRGTVAVLLVLGVLLFVALSVMMGAGSGFFNLRYYTPLWLLFMALTALGFRQVADGLDRARRPAMPRLARGDAIMGLLMLSLMVQPLSWVIRLPGHTTPYSHINDWMDEHLPAGTPVIVDRWFEPGHEMRFHAPSLVRPTFTIPNEPLEVFLQYNWRDTVRKFFDQHPDAAYLEMIKSYFYVPSVGPWDWPRRHFVRHVIFTNEPAMALRRSVLAPTEDFYSVNSNRLVVELFFNTRDDLVERARSEGRSVAAFYGAQWEYTKTQDYRDWRLLQAQASIDLYNLTEQPLDARLTVRAVAPERTKRVQTSRGGQETFPPNQLREWHVTLEALPPGRSELVLSDPLWGAARVPLLVEEIRIEPAGR